MCFVFKKCIFLHVKTVINNMEYSYNYNVNLQ